MLVCALILGEYQCFRCHAAELLMFPRSLGFAKECLDMHFGEIHRANLGDGDGEKDQQYLMREYYMPIIGTCVESLIGMNLTSMYH